MKRQTVYQKIADRIYNSIKFESKILIYNNTRLFWKKSNRWLELVVVSSASWFKVTNMDTINRLEEKLNS